MKKKYYLFLIILFLSLLNFNYVYAAEQVAAISNYEIVTNVSPTDDIKLDQLFSFYYAIPSKVYEFWNENNQYNIVFQISNDSSKLGWIKLDSNMKKISEVYLERELSIFGNALYSNGYLYVVYGKFDNETITQGQDNFATTVTMKVVKYNTSGAKVKSVDIMGKDVSKTNLYSTMDALKAYGARRPFNAGNCDLAINSSGIIKCVFSKEMYNGHQMSHAIYIDSKNLSFLNNTTTIDFDNKYITATQNYWASHSFDQRVIATTDGDFITVDQGDGNPRAFAVGKTYENESRTSLHSYNMFQFRNSTDGAYDYNDTMAKLGNIVEVSDGYILVGNSEKTLSDETPNSRKLNESENIFIQKYNKNFKNQTEQSIQMLNGEIRKSASRTDYGVKWLTNYDNNITILGTRAVVIDNNKIAILWAEKNMKKNSSNDAYTLDSSDARYYYEIIDSVGNVVKGPYRMQNAGLNNLIKYNYKNGYIYWSETDSTKQKIIVHKLDLNKTEDIAQISLNKNNATIEDSNITTYRLTATANRNTGITWKTSNSSIATVENGLVTILKNGTVKITASLNDYNVSDSCNLTIDYKCKQIIVNTDEDPITVVNKSTKRVGITINPTNANNKTLEWTSSNRNIAYVSSSATNNILISSENPGEVYLTGKTTDGTNIEKRIKVKVIQPIESVTITDSKSKMKKGEKYKFVATITPSNATDYVVWTSENENIATVDKNGLVTAKEGGHTYIYCRYSSGRVIKSLPLDVEVPLTSIKLDKEKVSIEIGKTNSLKVIYSPSDTTDSKTITWSSSNTGVATVNTSGVITAKKAGTATITAKVGSKTATCNVTVTSPTYPLQSISLNKTSTNLKIGGTDTLKVTYNPTNTTDNKQITWSSSNTGVATVNTSGVITAKKAGTATITAKVGTKTATCKVTVTEEQTPVTPTYPLKSINLNKTNLTINEDSTYKLAITYNPSNTTDNKTVTWTSSNTKVATVDKTGIVKGINEGTTIITAKVGNNTATCKVTVEYKLPFKDVAKNTWFYESVKWAYKNKVIAGYNQTTFAPFDKLSRGQLVTILWRIEGEPNTSKLKNKFTDVKEGIYYTEPIKWAAEVKIVSGYGGTTNFGPGDPIIRQDLCIILYKYAKYKGKNMKITSNLTSFADYKNVSDYAVDAVKWCVQNGVITGNALSNGTKTIAPHSNATRAEIAVMIMRYCSKFN